MQGVTRSGLFLALLLLVSPAWGQEALSGCWRDGGSAYFSLSKASDGSFRGSVRSPADLTLHDLRLAQVEGNWVLEVSQVRAVLAIGAAGRLEGPSADSSAEASPASEPVALALEGRILRSAEGAWQIKFPEGSEASAQPERVDRQTVLPQEAEAAPRPVVRVLITGFDRFPRLRNHPRNVTWEGKLQTREPRVNPAGWAVRQLTAGDLDPALFELADVRLHKCLDVPVTYVDGAKLITDAIQEVDADVVISFGVGSNGNADADVEATCSNTMDDANDPRGESLGPFQLAESWPPEKPKARWSAADRVWLQRYPDNAGVSYNGAEITPGGPETRRSLLPVERIVRRIESVRNPSLKAIDGGSGPGRYICNNVMYKVIETQEARGKLGGFIHMAQWSEAKRAKYLRVVALAIEESVRQFVEDQATGLPVEAPVVVATGESGELGRTPPQR
jgi:pyrrolidone-carboxylate peptidase